MCQHCHCNSRGCDKILALQNLQSLVELWWNFGPLSYGYCLCNLALVWKLFNEYPRPTNFFICHVLSSWSPLYKVKYLAWFLVVYPNPHEKSNLFVPYGSIRTPPTPATLGFLLDAPLKNNIGVFHHWFHCENFSLLRHNIHYTSLVKTESYLY